MKTVAMSEGRHARREMSSASRGNLVNPAFYAHVHYKCSGFNLGVHLLSHSVDTAGDINEHQSAAIRQAHRVHAGPSHRRAWEGICTLNGDRPPCRAAARSGLARGCPPAQRQSTPDGQGPLPNASRAPRSRSSRCL